MQKEHEESLLNLLRSDNRQCVETAFYILEGIIQSGEMYSHAVRLEVRKHLDLCEKHGFEYTWALMCPDIIRNIAYRLRTHPFQYLYQFCRTCQDLYVFYNNSEKFYFSKWMHFVSEDTEKLIDMHYEYIHNAVKEIIRKVTTDLFDTHYEDFNNIIKMLPENKDVYLFTLQITKNDIDDNCFVPHDERKDLVVFTFRRIHHVFYTPDAKKWELVDIDY